MVLLLLKKDATIPKGTIIDNLYLFFKELNMPNNSLQSFYRF